MLIRFNGLVFKPNMDNFYGLKMLAGCELYGDAELSSVESGILQSYQVQLAIILLYRINSILLLRRSSRAFD